MYIYIYIHISAIYIHISASHKHFAAEGQSNRCISKKNARTWRLLNNGDMMGYGNPHMPFDTKNGEHEFLSNKLDKGILGNPMILGFPNGFFLETWYRSISEWRKSVAQLLSGNDRKHRTHTNFVALNLWQSNPSMAKPQLMDQCTTHPSRGIHGAFFVAAGDCYEVWIFCRWPSRNKARKHVWIAMDSLIQTWQGQIPSGLVDPWKVRSQDGDLNLFCALRSSQKRWSLALAAWFFTTSDISPIYVNPWTHLSSPSIIK